jgi:integrase
VSAATWTYSAGAKPHTVTVYEREAGGTLYARAWDATARNGRGNWHRVSLGHRDKQRAKRYAIDEAAKLQKGEADITQHKVTLSQVFSLYLQHQTPRKSGAHQKEDVRRVEMWARVLGNVDPHTVSLAKWQGFVYARSSGAIDARGNPVAEKERRAVRTRGVEVDLVWLRAVFTWAAAWRLENGHYLMRENPVRGYDIPREKNPRRPIATQDRFEAVRAKSDAHTFEARWTGTRRKQRSYVSELLDIVNGTGRRISAICALRFDDLRLERTRSAPHGAIRWPEDQDKERKEWTAPISPTVRAAIDRVLQERPGIGRAPLFPAPGDTTVPMSRRLADKWLREVERMANLTPLEGKLWHAYRGKWATERKHLPDKDVAAAGGWKSTLTLKLYQQPDADTLLSVVLGGGELREAN